jgi:Family of unknown function (DUF5908)
MPVEIKELVIRAVVKDDEGNEPANDCVALTEVDRDTIVRLAVKEVLRILKQSKER